MGSAQTGKVGPPGKDDTAISTPRPPSTQDGLHNNTAGEMPPVLKQVAVEAKLCGREKRKRERIE